MFQQQWSVRTGHWSIIHKDSRWKLESQLYNFQAAFYAFLQGNESINLAILSKASICHLMVKVFILRHQLLAASTGLLTQFSIRSQLLELIIKIPGSNLHLLWVAMWTLAQIQINVEIEWSRFIARKVRNGGGWSGYGAGRGRRLEGWDEWGRMVRAGRRRQPVVGWRAGKQDGRRVVVQRYWRISTS